MKKVLFTYLLLLFSCHTSKWQVNIVGSLSDDEYKVINDLLRETNDTVYYYYKTDISKTWSFLMPPDYLDRLIGPPCNDGHNLISWDRIFSSQDFQKVRDQIRKQKPIEFNHEKNFK